MQFTKLFFTLCFKFLLENGSKEKKLTPFWVKKQNKKNTATIMTTVDWKETVFPVKLKLQEEPFK